MSTVTKFTNDGKIVLFKKIKNSSGKTSKQCVRLNEDLFYSTLLSFALQLSVSPSSLKGRRVTIIEKKHNNMSNLQLYSKVDVINVSACVLRVIVVVWHLIMLQKQRRYNANFTVQL